MISYEMMDDDAGDYQAEPRLNAKLLNSLGFKSEERPMLPYLGRDSVIKSGEFVPIGLNTGHKVSAFKKQGSIGSRGNSREKVSLSPQFSYAEGIQTLDMPIFQDKKDKNLNRYHTVKAATRNIFPSQQNPERSTEIFIQRSSSQGSTVTFG